MEKMTDYIYNSITEMPDDVLRGNIKVFERIRLLSMTSNRADIIIEEIERQIRRCKDELAKRQPDSLYVTNPDGTVELVDDMGELCSSFKKS